jgi:hypothetical protein
VPTSDYTPGLAEVGALERDRTVDEFGNEVGTFTAATRPTDTEAMSIIQNAVEDAMTVFGEDIPDAPGDKTSVTYDPNALREAAKTAVAYHSAALIELSHFGEQVARGNSPYQEYEDQWENLRDRVIRAIESAGGESPAGDTTGSQNPQFVFPEDAGGMIGWGTNW